MKKTIINHGANLVILPTTQFKTLHIAVDFSTAVEPENISARALVSYLTAVSSARYKTQQQVAQKQLICTVPNIKLMFSALVKRIMFALLCKYQHPPT